MDITNYRLPDGRIVPVDATATNGALIIGFTLIGGRVVDAVRADAYEPRYVTICSWCQTTPPPQTHVVYTHDICPVCANRLEHSVTVPHLFRDLAQADWMKAAACCGIPAGRHYDGWDGNHLDCEEAANRGARRVEREG